MDKMKRMEALILQLNEASKSYYQEDKEIMTNFEYDQLYDELLELENELNLRLSHSPTQKVGYEILSKLPKEEHESTMLSLDKTKSREELLEWLKDQEGMLSYKLDGLTIVLTYENGQLIKAVTRGNGTTGEVITGNAKMFKNIPLSIGYKERVVLRGEAVIAYSDFNQINEGLDIDSQYKNPRNLCSGSVRQLNNQVTATRNVRFYGFTLVSSQQEFDKKSEEIQWLRELGFECVDYLIVTKTNLFQGLDKFAALIESNDIGSDGLVLTYNNKNYSKSLGATSKFPKDTIAFKWKDELKESILRDIFWSASRTGLINPVAIFDPVDLEGTIVSRASLHNISIIEKLELGINDVITVYKANMIIPQIGENLTRSGSVIIPTVCPICHRETQIKDLNDVKVLYCKNDLCPAKKVKSFAHFVSRNAMNIEGLSEATIEKLIQLDLLHEYRDLFQLNQDDKRQLIVELEGFGEKSYANLITSIENAKSVKLHNFIFALGILQVGLSNAKLLCKAFAYDIYLIMDAKVEDLIEIEGYGDVIAQSIVDYFQNETTRQQVLNVLEYLNIEKVEIPKGNENILNKTFVITGSLELYDHREALKEVIESLGGKVTGSVSNKTDYLINNDVESNSSKNKKAKSLNIPILSESDFQGLIE